ncbi:hypothetical protein Tsubulata_043977 [Turnera subulata]|uniref:Brf1 TBP-binding domain-containing protein n=1 Tax=Turnera subulata TaxID=218843 RepID=A0A9Q0JMZ6_9ROSI|nr:hypothetical protein Tsubulata_043977 [Turnera subulata]
MEKELKFSPKTGGNSTKGEAFASVRGKTQHKGASTKNRNLDVFNRLCGQILKNTASDKVSEDVSGIDDSEIAGYLNCKRERQFKEIIWEAMNKKYLKARQLKTSRKAKKATPAEKAVKISGEKENKKRMSSKINYDVLKAFLDEPEDFSKALDGSMNSGYEHVGDKTQQQNEKSIVEAHDSASNDKSEEYEDENEHTDQSDADDYYHYGGDMHGEYENDGYDYLEENEEEDFNFDDDYA